MRGKLLVILLVLTSSVSFQSAALAGEPPCQDTVRAEGVGSTIVVHHDQAEWNCCATILFDLVEVQDTFNLYEIETFEVGPCDCICCFDLTTSIMNVTPGCYLVRALHAGTGEVFGEVWVTVGPGTLGEATSGKPWVSSSRVWIERSRDQATKAVAAQSGGPSLGAVSQSPCGGWSVGVEDPTSSTWGRIKALYR
ncbi:MAG: hypothetical protein AMJ46_10095 [Latescibacteria bacterium DG_63]|nr:MAG: hypothetical protein AMJ46_10095 [Latescibacteria bacterium DG_63]